MTIDRSLYGNCTLCPKKCRINRLCGQIGFCRSGAEAVLSCALLHSGEEPPVTGSGGSGTIFFTGCTLMCGFCQNYQISRDLMGSEADCSELSDIMISLQKEGAENINLVTATHFIPSVAEAVFAARKKELDIPVLWNTSGYETEESVDMLMDFVDVFLPDVKTLDPVLAANLFRAADYPFYAANAVLKMAAGRKTDLSLTGKEGVIRSGVIVRHLVLPGELESTDQFLKWFSENLAERAILSIMFQYEPAGDYCMLPDRRISESEADQVYSMLDKYDIEDGFIQETEEETLWLPDFSKAAPFPGSREDAAWHWKKGFRRS